MSRPKWNAIELFIIMLAYEYMRGGSRQQQPACCGEEKHSDTWWQRQCSGENNAHEQFGLFYCCSDISGSFSLFHCCYEHFNPFPTNSSSFLLWITTAIHANVIYLFLSFTLFEYSACTVEVPKINRHRISRKTQADLFECGCIAFIISKIQRN